MKKAVDIEWDVDFEEDRNALPTEIKIPKEIENDMDAISDYLSDTTGYCHCGYVLLDSRAKEVFDPCEGCDGDALSCDSCTYGNV